MLKPIVRPTVRLGNIFKKMSTLPPNQSIEGPAITSIKAKIEQKFPTATHIAIFNDSHKHMGHEGVALSLNKSESHIRIELVAGEFEGMKLPMRHRMIYKLISEEMDQYHIHAVQLKIKTPQEAVK